MQASACQAVSPSGTLVRMASSLNAHVAGEIRAELGRQNRSQASLAAALGWQTTYFSRRMTAAVPFTIDDLEAISAELGVSLKTLMPVAGAA